MNRFFAAWTCEPGLWALPKTIEIMAKTSCFSAGKHEKDYFPLQLWPCGFLRVKLIVVCVVVSAQAAAYWISHISPDLHHSNGEFRQTYRILTEATFPTICCPAWCPPFTTSQIVCCVFLSKIGGQKNRQNLSFYPKDPWDWYIFP